MKRTALLTLMALLFVSIIGNVPNVLASSGYHINAGGVDYTDTNNDLFVADKAYAANDFGYTGNTRVFAFNDAIANTDDDTLYQDFRAGNSFSYLFDIPDGDYDVTLYFMEPWQSAAGERLFDVSIEGTVVLDDYDIYATAGGQFTAVTETFAVTLTDGQLNIDFARVNRVAMVGAISVVSSAPPSPEPEITVSPTALDFGDVEENTTSDLTVTITNDGTADLNVSSLTTTNSVFTVESPTAPLVITPGNSEDVTVRFSPTTAGAQSGTLDIASDDADEPTVSVTLDGNGTTPPPNEPDINVTPMSLDFGDVDTGASSDLTVTIENIGLQDLSVTSLTSSNGDFTVSGVTTPATITPGNSVVATVTFAPSTTGAISGDLDITSDDPDEATVTVSLTGNGTTPPPQEPDINVTPLSIDFGSVTTGGSDAQTVTIENTGTQDLSVTDVTSSNGVFTISGITTPATVTPGNSIDVTVTFSPTADGVESGDLDIVSDDPDEGTVTVSLTGEGSATPSVAYRINAGGADFTTGSGDLFVADKAFTAGDFGYVGNIRTFTFGNAIDGTTDDTLYQSVNLNISLTYQFDLADGDYDVTLHYMEPFQSAAGERLFDVTIEGILVEDNYDIFAAAGAQFTAVTETYPVTVSDGQLNITLTRDTRAALVAAIEVVSEGGGTGPIDQEINVTPLSVDFGNVTVGNSFDKTVTIENEGGATLTVSSISSDNGQFTVESPTAPFDVNANSSTDVTVRFTPTGETTETGNLTIDSNDADEPSVVVSLTGTGTNSTNVSTYTDVTASAGMSNSHVINTDICQPTNNPPIGNGAAWGDYDGDGDIDAYVTNQDGANWLYSNDGDGTFTDMASSAGVAASNEISTGATFVDIDNDGDQDLWVGGHGGNLFFENNGDGTFSDATAASGLGDGGRAITAAWADFNEDGFLDVFFAKHKYCAGDDRQEDKLFVNDGDGTFTDVTTDYLCDGTAQCDDVMGLGFAPSWMDYDNDGDLDLFLINDDIGGAYEPNKLWRNDGSDGSGGWNFVEVSAAAGVDYSLNGMGLGVGDYDNDGDLDVAFSNMGPAKLLSNNGDGTFTDESTNTIIDADTTDGITWGTAFFDHDNDGDLDLYYTNGILAGTAPFDNYFFDNNGAGLFTNQSVATNLDDDGRARGLAVADFNGDGFPDVLISNYGETPSLLQNDGNSNNWLSVTVEGTESNRDGIGTRLILTANGVSQIRDISSGASHGGGDQRVALFGLGSEASGTLVVEWPNGEVENLGSVTAGQQLHLTEPPSNPGGGTTYIDVTAQVGITAVDTLPAGVCGVPAGNGIAWADYDNDGDVDAYINNHDGSNWLYRNDGDLDSDGLPNFTNQAAAAGVQLSSSDSMSAVFIDFDNDGDQDLYVTNDGGNTLFENQLVESGSATFNDITSSAGVANDGRAVTSAWADFNGDSYLDFYLAKHQACVDGTVDALYMNNGDDTFTNVTSYLCEGASQCQAVEGLGFSPAFLDYDNDGDLDLYLVNDDIGGNNTPNVLWRNDGDDGNGGWDFTDVSVASGANTSLNGMGLGVADYNNDGWLDLAFSNGQPGRLLENNGDGTFTDVASESNITNIVGHVTWGTVFFDYDNDGDQDLWFAAGSVAAQTSDHPNYMLENNGDETFSDVSAASGLDNPGRSRSGSIVDINNDGFVDLMSGNFGGDYTLYVNDSVDQGNNNNWLTITVEGTESNRDGIGTRISVTAGGITQIREINSGPTHGGGDYRAGFFGLGANTSATVEISWPNGVVENLGTVSADQLLHLVEPSSAPAEPDIDVVASADFGDAETGTSRDKLIDITNTGTTTLTISSMTVNNSVFSVVTTTPVDIAAGATSKITVRFSPTSDGVETGDLTIDSNDPDEASVVVALTGNGVTAASTTFVDVIGLAGIDATHTLSSTCSPPVGAGSAWADYDNDGDIDVYITDHGAANNLYRNDGDNNSDGVPEFTDVAVSFGLDDAAGVGHATNFIDYDNDGDQDLYVSNWGASFLYKNMLVENGSVSFVDVTATAGLLDDGRTITAAWADYDNDGNLDVYLAKHAYCGGSDPRNFDKLYRSNGDGTFTDVTATAMCSNCDPIDNALGFSAGWFDYDNDGDLDLYVVNDILQGDGSGGTENYHNVMWRNEGNGSFTEVSDSSGTDIAVNGMGLGIGDIDNDGDFDIAFSDVGASTVLSNNGDGTYSDVSHTSNGGTGSLTWGTAFFDYNNDGWLDLYFASGLIGSGGVTPDIFMENNQNGTFTDISVASGLNNSNRGRHAAMVDFDLDGLVDLFVGNYGTPAALYQNRADVQGNTNNWLFVTVEGTDSNRDGIGTRLTLTAGGTTQIREINSGATHGGGDYRAAYFGLDTATSGTLVIEWPNGETETITIGSGDINQYMHRVEPASGS